MAIEISKIEAYYLIVTRLGDQFMVWNANDTTVPTKLSQPFDLKGMNNYYAAFDRGSCLFTTHKKEHLFDGNRVVGHAMQAAQALVSFAILEKGWKQLEFSGRSNTMINAAIFKAAELGAQVLSYNLSARQKKILESYQNNTESFKLKS